MVLYWKLVASSTLHSLEFKSPPQLIYSKSFWLLSTNQSLEKLPCPCCTHQGETPAPRCPPRGSLRWNENHSCGLQSSETHSMFLWGTESLVTCPLSLQKLGIQGPLFSSSTCMNPLRWFLREPARDTEGTWCKDSLLPALWEWMRNTTRALCDQDFYPQNLISNISYRNGLLQSE